jgi:hypothetical protein
MKTTLTLLIAGLLFLTTPLIASAQGDRYNDGPRHTKGWVSDRHDRGHYYDYRGHRGVQQHQRNKKHLRNELRETRRELRQVKRQIRHKRGYQRPYYARPGVVIGIPNVVFRFDW